jgi:transposase
LSSHEHRHHPLPCPRRVSRAALHADAQGSQARAGFFHRPDQEFIVFLKSLARRYPGRELHLICDNYGTHKHPAVYQSLAAHPRFHLHFTPTSASWLNLIERWFAIISQQAIRRGSFHTVAELQPAITRFLEHWNQDAKPFVWIKTAEQIKRSIQNAKLISEA